MDPHHPRLMKMVHVLPRAEGNYATSISTDGNDGKNAPVDYLTSC